LIGRLKADPGVVETRMRMADNAANLGPGFPETMAAAYGGAALRRQELDGEMIDDCIDAVDPCISTRPGSDACGIVLAGVKNGVAYVLGDSLAPGLTLLVWAERPVQLAEMGGASATLAEANPGGDKVRDVIAMPGTRMPVRLVTARLSKRGRAQPVAALYAQGKVREMGTFHTPENQMCRFGTADVSGSPGREDALVWALWAPMVEGRGPRVRVVG
jgi:phage terminase large subunit-like protein